MSNEQTEEKQVGCEKCKNRTFYGFVRDNKIYMRCTECTKTLLEAELVTR